MSGYVNEDSKNKSVPTWFDGVSNQNKALFKLALAEAMDSKICNIESEIKDVEAPPPSIHHKNQMNRLFRERVGGHFIPFTEADDLSENEAI